MKLSDSRPTSTSPCHLPRIQGRAAPESPRIIPMIAFPPPATTIRFHMNYFISDGVNQNGPYPVAELLQHGLRANSLVWAEGMSEWKRADQVDELANLLRDQPATAPAVPQPPPARPQAVQPIGYHSAYQQISPQGYAQPLPQGMAITSMVLGICSLVFLLAYCIGIVPGILAVIFGHMALGRIRIGAEQGKSMALAGLICGYISLGLTALFVIAAVLFGIRAVAA